MSKQVDERVVSMQFDNKQFESNVSTTMSTLDKLKAKLRLDGASKGLENVGSAAKKVDVSPIGQGVEAVRAKFSALEVMGVTALANITNSAVNAGKRIASAFTIEPIKLGFQEYETQINSVQTILANTQSKGTTLKQVNAALDELNKYADMTIYNFTEMTRNIGTFTAAGVDLDTSVSAIKGIANLAAVSGSNSQQASTAMYQLSQALAAGRVSLMDWNSVVNAGMGGQVFQDALKETARVHGVNIDAMIEKQGSFRETLQEGWLTSEVLIETLSKFTGDLNEEQLKSMGYTDEQIKEIIKLGQTANDAATKVKTFTQLIDTLKEAAQSGWTQTWETIVGDFEEAKELWTGVSDVVGGFINDSAEARNKVLSGAFDSGWDQLLSKGIADEEGYKESIKNIAKEYGVNFDDIIEKAGSFDKALNTSLQDGTITSDMMSKAVTNLADKMRKMSKEELEAAGYTNEHLVSIEALESGLKKGTISMDEFTNKMIRPSGRELLIETVKNAFNGLVSVIKPVKEAFDEVFKPLTSDQLYGFLSSLKNLSEKLTITSATAENLKRTFKGVFALLNIGIKIIKAVFTGFSKMVGYLLPVGDGILGVTASVGDFIVKLNNAIESSNIFIKIINGIGTILKPVADGVKIFATSISDSFNNIVDKTEERFKPLSTIGNAIKAIFIGIAKVFEKIMPIFSSIASKIGEVFKGLQENISTAIQNSDYNSLFDIINGGILSAIGIGIFKFIKSLTKATNNASGFLKNIKGILGKVSNTLGAFTESIKANTLKTIAISIAILAGSLLVLSLIPSDKIASSLGMVTALFIEMFASMSVFGKITEGKEFKNIGRISIALLGISASLLVLSIALKIMSTMTWNEMGVGLVSLTVGLGLLVAAVNLLPETKVKKAAKAIKKMASALLILSIAIKIMSTMSWDEMTRGLMAMVVGLGAMVTAIRLLPKNIGLQAIGLISIASAMFVLSIALKIMATMSWNEVAKSLVTLAGSLTIISIALNSMRKAIPGALAMPIIATGLLVLSVALKVMGSMSWSEVARGLIALGGSLIIIAGAMDLMKTAIFGAAALIMVAASLAVIAPVLKLLGSMDLAEIGKSLLILVGVFTLFGIAAYALAPVAPVLLAITGAMALFGVGILAIGAGVTAFAIGLGLLGAALTASGAGITAFVVSIISLIPFLIKQIGIGIVELCKVIANSTKAICDAVAVIIISVVKALVDSVPYLVEGLFIIIDEVLLSLVKHTPIIVKALLDFLIVLINSIAEKLPALIQAGVNLIMAFFNGVIDALKNIDPEILIKGILGVGFMTALMAALASMAFLTGPALVGVIGFGLVIAELAIVLTAIGALASIPGLEWLINKGGDLMLAVGKAIGKFIGGIVGGIANGISSSLPQIGTDLSTFMKNIQPFIDGAMLIDNNTFNGVKALTDIILTLTGANILEGLTSWLTGGSSLTKFGKELADFAPNMKLYADTISGIDNESVQASANAAKALTELASTVPNEGGVAAWFAGENSIASFGEQLPILGKGLLAFSDSVSGVNPENVVSAAKAAKALTDMASTVPNEGGVAAWFAGENSIASFGSQLPILGSGLLAFSMSVAGINPDNIVAAATSAKAITELASTIPNEGGVAAWFAGDNSVASFGSQLPVLGAGLLAFSKSVAGIVPDNIISAADAAKAIAEMANIIPNEGGMVAWFTGDNSISHFASQFPILGAGLLSFSMSVSGINPENIVSAASAAKALAEMSSIIPNEGGMVAWFTGDNSIASFSSQLPILGAGLLAFSMSVNGIVPENLIAASTAAKTLAEMTNIIPNEGGIVSWFAGDNSVASFGSQLPVLGAGLLAFSMSAVGINPEAVKNAAISAKSLVELTNTIPNVDGFASWFSGESGVAQFSSQLPILGAGLLAFSMSAVGINPEAVTAAANAGKALAEMTKIIPNEGGIKAWFSGESGIAQFAENIPSVGTAINKFATNVGEIIPENVTAAANAGKALAEMAETTPKNTDKLSSFGENLVTLSTKLTEYFTNTSTITEGSISTSNKAMNAVKDFGDKIDSKKVKSACNAIDDLVKTIKGLSKIEEDSADGFSKALSKVSSNSVDAIVDSFKDGNTKLSKAGKTAIDKVISGANDKASDAKKSFATIIDGCITTINNYKSKFESAGGNLVSGFVKGISKNSYKAAAKSAAMASAAASAARKELDIDSPSKVFNKIGNYAGLGFVNALDSYTYKSEQVGSDLAKSSIDGLRHSISKISDVINGDIDSSPTIRPILDLSNVQAGANSIDRMFTAKTLSLNTDMVNSVSASMANYQNGKGNGDVVSAIKALRNDIANMPRNTYSINGITYDDGSNVSDAIQSLIRAARIERRV